MTEHYSTVASGAFTLGVIAKDPDWRVIATNGAVALAVALDNEWRRQRGKKKRKKTARQPKAVLPR